MSDLLKKAKKIAKKSLELAKKHKLVTKLSEYAPEEYKEKIRKVGELTGTGKKKRGMSAEHMAKIRAMRGKGVGKTIKKTLKDINKFAKKSKILSSAAEIAGRSDIAENLKKVGYGKTIKKTLKDINKFAKKNKILSTAAEIAGRSDIAENLKKVGYGKKIDMMVPLNTKKRGGDAPLDTVDEIVVDPYVVGDGKKRKRKIKGGDANSGGYSMISPKTDIYKNFQDSSDLNEKLSQDDVNNLAINTGFFTNPILTGTSTAYNPNPDDVYGRIQAQGGTYGGTYSVNPLNQGRNSIASLYRPVRVPEIIY